MTRTALLLTILLSACSVSSAEYATPEPVEAHRNGSRLKMLRSITTGEDGSYHSTASGMWWDNELQVPCTPRRTRDGSLRCIPDSPPTVVYYSDPACTELAVRHYLGACGPPGKFASLSIYSDSPCTSTTYAVYRVGAERPQSDVFNIFNGRCTSASSFVESTPKMYHVGEELPPEAMVLMTSREEP